MLKDRLTIDHPRNAELIRNNDGRLVKLRELPVTHQNALIHYMSVDGASWAVEEEWLDWQWGEGTPCEEKMRLDMLADIEKFRPRFIEKWGDVEFGIVEVPTSELIEAVLQDEDFPTDEASKHYQKSNEPEFDADWEYDRPMWPVIFSEFDFETLQDGWTRFGRYCKLGVDKIPCVYYV